nr:MAG TPA: hypothetical protein [Caudoviricetes sp.]
MNLKRIKFCCLFVSFRQQKTANKGGVCEANNGIAPIEGGKPLFKDKRKARAGRAG